LALLFMTAVIEIFVYAYAWPTNGVWATCFLVIIARGPGAFSADHLIARRFKHRAIQTSEPMSRTAMGTNDRAGRKASDRR